MTAPAAASPRRGRPLVALALLLVGWTATRFALWESPFARAVKASIEQANDTPPLVIEAAPSAALSQIESGRSGPADGMSASTLAPVWPTGARAPGVATADEQSPLHGHFETPVPRHLSMTAAPMIVQPVIVQPVIVQPGPASERVARRRFHLAGWIAWREGSGLPQVATGALPPSYGGSQAGFLAQFDVADGPRRPALHIRATYAPDRPQQAEIAAGIGLRPAPAVPVRILGEVRMTHVEARTEVRPALFAVTELAPISLPLGIRAEGFAQGGWVGGRYATAFADGQARLTHAAVAAGRAQFRVGAGAWGGAQKFAERLDVGPTLVADLPPVRMALDYRIRVAGNARPGNGLAVTLSTGF